MNERRDLKLIFDSSQLQPYQIEKSVLSFEREITELSGVEKRADHSIHKDIDPLLFATLSISLAPIAAQKFFEFLNAWTMRRENRLIKIKIQVGRNKYIEFEGSETLSKKDVENWISAIDKALKHK